MGFFTSGMSDHVATINIKLRLNLVISGSYYNQIKY